MRAKRTLLSAAPSLVAAVALAQSYSIDWHTIDGGGGTASGGGYSVAGTIGQPDASPRLTAGNFSLTGGFWSVLPSPGAPFLKLVFANGNGAVVSWPSPSLGFVLEQNATLNPGSWVAAPETVLDDGTTKSITVASPTGHRFYRLRRP